MVAFPDAALLDITGPLQVLISTNQLAARTCYDVVIASEDGRPVRTSGGVMIGADIGFDAKPPSGDLIIPGGPGVDEAIKNRRLLDYLCTAAAHHERIISVCSGSMLLAEAGLLDGKEATSHWARGPDLLKRYPKVRWKPDAIYTRDGNIYCSAGVTAGIDLTLALVEADFGRELALDVARELVVFMRRSGSQSQFSRPLMAQHALSPRIADLCRAVADDPERDWRVSDMSRFAHMTERSLHRQFLKHVGKSPSHYVESVRLDLARSHLDQHGSGMEEVARRSGFGSAQTMRRAFVKHLGITPQTYRDRFGV
ncbi:MAG: GlxA family transcriptional regulator [Geminicoccaceae bacterium]